MRFQFLALYSVITCFSFSALAFDLTLPVDCKYGDACVISNYFDTNPEEEEAPQDYTCSGLTQEGEASTTFMLRDLLEMRKGVAVLSAEDGQIKAVRDGMDDVSVGLSGRASVRGRECGNGVIIEHKRGFVTEYCHLQKGSIIVEAGDRIQKGGRIGLVGMSGDSEFPNLKFTVRRRGEVYDPFLGDEKLRCGSLKAYPLWDRQTRKKLQYIPTKLFNAHFINRVPYAMGAREGKFRRKTLSTHAEMIVFWVDVFGIKDGDILTLQLLNPEGEVLEQEMRKYEREKRRHFQFIGKKLKQAQWPEGEYTGKVRLKRIVNGEEQLAIDASIPIMVNTDAKDEDEVFAP